jgi:hypothetical protein
MKMKFIPLPHMFELAIATIAVVTFCSKFLGEEHRHVDALVPLS